MKNTGGLPGFKLTSDCQAFEFLNKEEELYSKADLKGVYNGQG